MKNEVKVFTFLNILNLSVYFASKLKTLLRRFNRRLLTRFYPFFLNRYLVGIYGIKFEFWIFYRLCTWEKNE